MGTFQRDDAGALAHGLAGAISGVASIAVCFPLEVLRTRQQVGDVPDYRVSSRVRYLESWSALLDIAQREGVRALYQGFSAVLITTGVTNFVYFCAYSANKRTVLTLPLLQGSPLANFVVAGAAGVVTVLLTTPLWLVNTRMKVRQSGPAPQAPAPSGDRDRGRDVAPASLSGADGAAGPDAHPACKAGKARPYTSLLDGLVRVAREEGLATLWDGTVPSLILVSNPSIQWAVYESLKELWARSAGASPTTVEIFALAALAKAIATVATYPLQVAQTALRYNHGARAGQCGTQEDFADKLRAKRYAGTMDCLLRLYRASGLRGIFRGLEAKLLQTVLTAGFHVATYEKLVHCLAAVLRLWRVS